MNILLYIPYVDKSFGGVLQYSKCLISILQKDQHNKYYLFLRNNYSEFQEFHNAENFYILPVKETNYRTSLFNIFEILLFNGIAILEKLQIKIPIKRPYVVDKVIKKYKIDILHCTYQHLPTVNIPTMATMHDVQELHFPDFFSAEIRAVRAVEYLNITKHATKIIVSYEHIKQDLIRFFKVDPSRIEVVLLNMKNLWFEKFENTNIDNIKIELPVNYILYPAATWKHKNHVGLLKAIKILKDKYGLIVNLVCTGQQSEYYSDLEKLVDDLQIKNQIKFLGKVKEDELYYIYKKANAIVIPTLYEAGSFPLMESILMGIPCICSNVTSLPETIGLPEYTFNPNDSNEMADKILKITTDADYREILLKHYQILVKNLTNTHSVQIFSYIYDSLNPVKRT